MDGHRDFKGQYRQPSMRRLYGVSSWHMRRPDLGLFHSHCCGPRPVHLPFITGRLWPMERSVALSPTPRVLRALLPGFLLPQVRCMSGVMWQSPQPALLLNSLLLGVDSANGHAKTARKPSWSLSRMAALTYSEYL
ncbi:hypothetical protein PG990_011297 [Apiospora arundinis]|uniref:Uncharacterized protein n=1 Tax=Apiospora arundinis TaxID=335852 RepID=A0ABR2JID7_9PEZI